VITSAREPADPVALEARSPEHRAAIWVVLAGGVGFAASAVFSSVLQLQRAAFVAAYAVVAATFVVVWGSTTPINLVRQLPRRWIGGLLGGLVVGVLLIRGVARQPRSATPQGADLVTALAWFGLVYGAVDAMLLSVVPVLSVYSARRPKGIRSPRQHLTWGILALAASLFVTALYHLGFREFRGPTLLQPLIGNAIITAGYLLTGSPLAAFVAHVLMHGAAVVHGMETTVQLPPHY
jgi:amino acid transporter